MQLFVFTQKSYSQQVLERFKMNESKPISTPLGSHFRLSSKMSPKGDNGIEEIKHVPYASSVRSLMYAMVCTRPDLAYSASLVSRFMGNLGKEHLEGCEVDTKILKELCSNRLDICKKRYRN